MQSSLPSSSVSALSWLPSESTFVATLFLRSFIPHPTSVVEHAAASNSVAVSWADSMFGGHCKRRALGGLLADQPWVTVAENVAVLTVVLEAAEVTGVTEVVVEAVAGAEAGRMRRKSGCLAPNWGVWFSR